MNKNRAVVRKEVQYRAEDLKVLTEQRAEMLQEMEEMTTKAETEQRAMTEEENTRFDELEEKIRAIDETVKRTKTAKEMKLTKTKTGNGSEESTTEELEERAFLNYIKKELGETGIEVRAGEQNLTMGDNGAIIPSTIANRIISEVKDICPILSKATIYNVKGTLKVPVWGTGKDGNKITVSYQEEFEDITANSGAFSSIDLSGYLAGALTLIGKSVANNAEFDVISFIVTEIAKEIALFFEKELLIGTEGKAEGALSTKNKKTTASAIAITADELIETQAIIKQAYQASACWIMHPNTFTIIKKLKDGNGRYLLQDDYTSEFPYKLLGKPVYLSDNMPEMAAGKKAVLYGDLSGLSVNMRENVQIQILLEKYATKHAIGIVSWFEFDSKVTEHAKLAALEMKAA